MKHFFIFKKLAFIALLFFHPGAFAQPKQKQSPVAMPPELKGSLAYLLQCNGFKQLRLGESVKHLQMDKMAYLDGIDSLDTDSCHKFAYQDDAILDMGNGIFLNLVGLRTYKDKIVNIYLFFKRDAGYSLLRQFEAEYGKFTSAPGEFMYDWKTNGVTLSLRYKEAIDMGVAIFTCDNVEQQVMRDNAKRAALQGQSKNLLGSL